MLRRLGGLATALVLVHLGASLLAAQAGESAPAAHSAGLVREAAVITEDGVRLAFRIEGNAADTLVVLHGGPGVSGESVRPDLLPLARDFTLIFYDQRGSGLSTPVTDSSRISLAHHVADLEAVRAHFGLERMVLAGHSWGAGLALHYALAHPQRTERLLLIDPIPLRRDPHAAEFSQKLRAWMDESSREEVDAALHARRAAPGSREACLAYWELFIRGYLADPHGSNPVRGDQCYGTPETLANRVNALTLGPLGAWDWRKEARRVQVPALIIHGERSPIPTASFHEWGDALPQGQLLSIAGSGHFPYAERPAVFFPAARAFLRRAPGAPLPMPEAWDTSYVLLLEANPTYQPASQEVMQAMLQAHLQYQLRLNADGRTLMGGPLVREEGTPLAGMTVLRAASREEAEAIARADPGVAGGLFNASVRTWTTAGTPPSPEPDPADVATIEGIMHACYDVINGPPGAAAAVGARPHRLSRAGADELGQVRDAPHARQHAQHRA
jgi:proline iminopeptidase